uniref:PABS domain-containing protein n=2 Tax=Ascarididae TaxID=6250 RepID=A0A914ZT77_PARUN
MYQRGYSGFDGESNVSYAYSSAYDERAKRNHLICYGVIMFICACIVVKVIYNYTYVETPKERSFRNALEIAYRGQVVLEKFKSDLINETWEVTDRGWVTHEDELRVYRNVFTIGQNRSWLTTAKLITPTEITDFNKVTSDWPVDTRALATNYKRMLAMAPFFTETISFDENAIGNILIVGLRGGGLSNFLHGERKNLDITVAETDPIVREIAKKWFGLKENKRYRVIINDGVNVIRDRLREKKSYDVILLDSCYFGYENAICCPTKPYLEEANLQLMKESLSHKGVLAANVYALRDHDESFETVIKTYRNVFENCLVLDVMLEANKILVCYKRKIDNEDKEKEKIDKAIENIKLQFALDFWDKY